MNPIWKDRSSWGVGQRVTQTHPDRLGTIVENGRCVKVELDDGATSYYFAAKPENVSLDPKE
jgi:hypothetical protein